jgi:hypothetical protein
VLLLAAAEVLEHALQICWVISSMPGGAMISMPAGLRHLDLDLLVVELAFAQLLAEFLAGGVLARRGSSVESRSGARRRQQRRRARAPRRRPARGRARASSACSRSS